MERDKTGRQFVRKRDRLFAACEAFIDDLTTDTGKPWQSFAKSSVNRISLKITHARDRAELVIYEAELKRLETAIRNVRTKAEHNELDDRDLAHLEWMIDNKDIKEEILDEMTFLNWIPDSEKQKVKIMVQEENWGGLLFYDELGMLRRDCQGFIDAHSDEIQKLPWYSLAKVLVDMIIYELPRTLQNHDLNELEKYEQELTRLKTEVRKIEELAEHSGYNTAYGAFLAWQREEELRERNRVKADILFYQKQDLLFTDCMEFVEELMDSIGENWYYNAKSRAEMLSDKIAYALDIKRLNVYANELKLLKAKVLRIKLKVKS